MDSVGEISHSPYYNPIKSRIYVYVYSLLFFFKCSHGYSLYPHDIPKTYHTFPQHSGASLWRTRNRQVHEMTFPDGAAPPEELGELGEAGGCWEGDEFGPWFQE